VIEAPATKPDEKDKTEESKVDAENSMVSAAAVLEEP